MGSEKLKITQHHFNGIMELIEGSGCPSPGNERIFLDIWVLPTLFYFRIGEEDELGYPFLRSREEREKYFDAFAETIRAIGQADYEVIPDIDHKTGKVNFDYICENCGNCKQDRCILLGKLQLLEETELTISRKLW